MVNAKRALVTACGAALCVAFLTLACGSSSKDSKTAAAETTAVADTLGSSLEAEALSILERSCAGCHGGAYPKARLSLEPERIVAAMRDVPSRQIDTLMLVDTRDPGRSYLLMKIRGDEGIRGDRMPDDAAPLSAEAVDTIEQWVRGLARP